jgi:HK97 family phage prohead protease
MSTEQKLEQRRVSGAGLRAGSQGAEKIITGYAASFNVLSQDLGGFREQIAPGAFTQALTSDEDAKMLFNHSPNFILGRRKNNTLTLEQDQRGLKFRCVLPDTQQARDLHASIERGDVDECSFAFYVPDGCDDWDFAEENGVRFKRRTLRNGIRLSDVSAVVYPAYDAPGSTEVNARNKPADYTVAATASSPEAEKLARLNNIIADSDRRSRLHAIEMKMLQEGK